MSETLDCASRQKPIEIRSQKQIVVFLEMGWTKGRSKLKSRGPHALWHFISMHPINWYRDLWLRKSALTTWSFWLNLSDIHRVEVCGPTLPDKVNENHCKTPWHQEMQRMPKYAKNDSKRMLGKKVLYPQFRVKTDGNDNLPIWWLIV